MCVWDNAYNCSAIHIGVIYHTEDYIIVPDNIIFGGRNYEAL